MPAIITNGELSQGHGGFPAVPAVASQDGVYIAGKAVILVGDQYASHNHGGDHPHPHIPIATVGSPTVYVGGIGVVRDGDPLNCGDSADTQSNFSVFADGGGNVAEIIAGFVGEEGETLGYTVIGITDSYPTLPPIRVRYTIGNLQINEKIFQEWCPTTPFVDPNGFEITLKEEETGTTYTSLRGVGATSLPSSAPETIRGPLDSRVSYTLEDTILPGNIHSYLTYRITQYYSIDSVTGRMTFTPSSTAHIGILTGIGQQGPANVLGKVTISYGSGIILKQITVNLSVGRSTAAC